MTTFVLGSLALLAITLAFVLPPLWRRARGSALVLAAAIPLAAAGLYAMLGVPAALDFGIYGATETFLIDANGMIVWKHVGVLTPELIRDELEPKLAQLEAAR